MKPSKTVVRTDAQLCVKRIDARGQVGGKTVDARTDSVVSNARIGPAHHETDRIQFQQVTGLWRERHFEVFPLVQAPCVVVKVVVVANSPQIVAGP